mmetsp:Transcript_17585/g.23272  ORF Transcript_17585/g.23272 Transcript_17585/m.23272 type:complete len:116 (-) Transcript_17585:85-432(-)
MRKGALRPTMASASLFEKGVHKYRFDVAANGGRRSTRRRVALSNVDRSAAFSNSWRDGKVVEGSIISWVMDFRRVIGDGLAVAPNLRSMGGGEEGMAGAEGDMVDDADIVFGLKM